MRVLDAGAGWGNLWRYNQERLPDNLAVTCVDKHNTHMDTFCEYVQEQKKEGQFEFQRDTYLFCCRKEIK